MTLIKTSPFHQYFTLLGRSSITFAILLLILYSTSFWFDYNASYFGLIAVLISLPITHYCLLALESNASCKLFSFIFKGKPPVVYTKFLRIHDKMLSFGKQRLLFSAISHISLSPLGNLVFRSNALGGPPENSRNDQSMVVLKLPFSAINLETQKDLINLFKIECPGAVIAPSLENVLKKALLKPTAYVHVFMVIIFFAVLMDIGNSSFTYIELLKRYYLSKKYGMEKKFDEAKETYESAEQLRTHSYQFSIIMPKLVKSSSTSSGLLEAESEALWYMGKTDEAIKAQAKAAKLMPQSFKINLRLARFYAKAGNINKAIEAIDFVSDRHKHALLPRLYSASLLLKTGGQNKARTILQNYLSALNDEYFYPPPVWPPAGEDNIHELFTQEDLEFLLSNIKKEYK